MAARIPRLSITILNTFAVSHNYSHYTALRNEGDEDYEGADSNESKKGSWAIIARGIVVACRHV